MQRIDKYEVLEVIGRGAMGAVYKALHPQFKKYVAIKEILADLAHHPEIQQRFAREAELLAQLPAHPNIVMVRDALVWENKLYLVMDYIEGGTLGEVVKKGPVPPQQAVVWLDQVLSGLDAIHARGIIHRDLKASNILLGRDGTAYLSDFGIAESTKLSQAGDAMATAKCVAPEMIDAALGRNAEPQQADIYAAGILAYELLLGETKFRQVLSEIYANQDGSQVAQRWLAWHTDLSRPAPNLHQLDPAIPQSLAAVVERMMAKDVTTRYRKAHDVRRDLAALQQGKVAMNEQHRPAADDATVPLSQLRNQPVARNAASQPPPSVPPTPPASAPSKSRIPAFALIGIAGAGLFLLLAAGLWAMQRTLGFTVIVKGLPTNSTVFVNDIPRGIPMIVEGKEGKAEREIRVTGLKAGEMYSLRLACGGELLQDGQPIKDKLTGQNGDEIVLQGRCGGAPPPTGTLADEINLQGPMRLVKAGPFIMGDDKGNDNEKPAHRVDIPYNYYIDKFEVTNRQFAEFCKATNRQMPANPFWDTSYAEKNPDQPVVGVTWEDAQAYAQWAGKDLPTEAEWEKAASWDPKATDADPKWKRKWPWGNAGSNNANTGTGRPTNVGSKTGDASSYGVMDMAGNVSEWVKDNYQAYPGNQVADSNYGAGHRVIRGSNIKPGTKDFRTTLRYSHSPTYSPQELQEGAWLIGFRCAARADSPKVREVLQKK
ncbi:MAG TPA: bifunctional serine/threonine-protein kinase/formylglycine-generating enzyme family protein [Blastocatellia bacterium]|nr:bifunctional serine/threonine-protein kinase/formylglycine-generating enzyme family protein [Blastocatellia bacterium]